MLFLAWQLFAPNYMTPEYLRRVIFNGDSQVTDWRDVFPRADIANDPTHIGALPTTGNDGQATAWAAVSYYRDGATEQIGPNMEKFLADSDTSSFIVVRNGQIVYEAYAQGTTADTIHTSMSAAKSFMSALTGIAIRDGFINSVNDSVVEYLPELKDDISGDMTIRDLLTMTAGNAYDDKGGLTGDDTKFYWSPRLKQLVLDYFRSAETPGVHMHYNDIQPQVLGMILERATGKKLAQFTEEVLWRPAGMEYAASWSLDSKTGSFAQSAVGFNARSRDFARFGLLYLQKGIINGSQVIPEAWVVDSTFMEEKPDSYFQGWHDSNAYGYYWWGNRKSDGSYDFYARGKYGQFIYVSPANNTVIVRTGASTGQIQDWPQLLEQIADR